MMVPMSMMPRVIVAKNLTRSCVLMTFLSMSASGNDNPTVAIMNAKAVPMETPLITSACTIGTTPTAFEYNGTATMVASGTVHHAPLCKVSSKNDCGTKP